MNKRTAILPVLALICFQCGPGVTFTHRALRPDSPAAAKATVLISGALDIKKINDDSVNLEGDKFVFKDSTLYLPPGKHKIVVHFRTPGGRAKQHHSMDVSVVGGKTYRVAWRIRIVSVEIRFLELEEFNRLKETDGKWN